MPNKYQKYVNALFLAAAALVWFVMRHYVDVAIGYFQLGRKLGNLTDVLHESLPLIFGVITFLLLRKNNKSYEFTTDSVAELSRIVWPSSKEVRFGTIVVIITVVSAGIVLGFLDVAFTNFVRAVIGA